MQELVELDAPGFLRRRRVRRIVSTFVIVCLTGLIVLILLRAVPPILNDWGSIIVVAGVIALLIWRLILETKFANLRPMALLHAGYCPCCGYDLRGAMVQPDGCSICPECGAAWRLDPDPRMPASPTIDA